MGGGGGGGSILIVFSSAVDNTTIKINGGKGADMSGENNGKLGPGGGGGAGVVWLNTATLPSNFVVAKNGGLPGVNINIASDTWGATAGQSGINMFNLVLPTDNVLFVKNIDSVRIKDSNTICKAFDFKGFGFTNTTPITSWQWFFGDGITANTQNASHSYAAPNTYTVKLVVFDINGCKDSISKSLTVTNCTIGISSIINDYTPVLSLGVCTNTINVVDAGKYNIGDTVLIIQMKGAIIDTTNTAAFGDVINYKNAGNYEFNYIKSKTGNAIELRNKLTRQYDLLNGKVQLIRVPYYTSVTTTSTLTCLPWDGNIGGVLVFNVRDTLILNADIDVSKNGFKGGKGVNTFLNSTNCGQINYYYPNGSVLAALKGENIAVVQQDKAGGRGAPSNGGGGGQDHNSGGGGGSNGALGGFGGYQWQDCPNSPFDNRGWGGKALVYTNAANKVFLGGGAGAGHCNNLGFNSDGGNGGGIVIINTNKIINNGRQIISNGGDALIVSLMAVLAIAMKVWAVVVVVAPY